MSTQYRSLPANRTGTIESIQFTGGSPKESTAYSTESAIYRQYGSPSDFKSDTVRSSKKTKKSIRLSDLMAAMYPGVKIGHKYCVQRATLVPKTMGWLWNSEDTANGVPFPRGWRPGAIALGVKKKFFRPRAVSEPLSTPVGSKGKKIGKKKAKTTNSSMVKSTSESLTSYTEKHLPTLCVQKEGGIYRVMMQPIKNATNNTEDEQPVQFKIAEHSTSSYSRTSKSSSSSLKIEYMCTGALRKPIVKPELAEMSTQWDTSDFQKKEPEKKEEAKNDIPKSDKKKGKKKSPSKDETNTENLTNEKKEPSLEKKNEESKNENLKTLQKKK